MGHINPSPVQAGTYIQTGQGGLLAAVSYRPGSDITAYAISNTTMADLDAVNLILPSIVVPTSGRVLVRLSATAGGNANNCSFGVREGASNLATDVVTNASTNAHPSVPFLLTLTPGSSHIFKWGAMVGAGTWSFFAGPTFGALVMEAWAA